MLAAIRLTLAILLAVPAGIPAAIASHALCTNTTLRQVEFDAR